MAGLEFVHTYLDDLLIISNSTFEDHLRQLQVVLHRLRRAGLKVNVEKSSFFAPPTFIIPMKNVRKKYKNGICYVLLVKITSKSKMKNYPFLVLLKCTKSQK